MIRFLFVVFSIVSFSAASGQSSTSVQYLANEGVMVTDGDTKVLFDPLYENSYDRYQLVPEEMRTAIFDGRPPFDNIDAVFVSHYHGDHFSAGDMLRLLKAQSTARLYAPAQAIAALREIATDNDESVFQRVIGLDLEYGESPFSIETDNLVVDAVYIPHSGWPTARTDVQNLAFRITLNANSTVLHLGDADPRIIHFANDEEYWDERTVDLAFPPYWFFGSDDGLEILEDRLDVTNSVGVHVPAEFENPANVPDELRGFDLFTRPGDGRRFIGSQ